MPGTSPQAGVRKSANTARKSACATTHHRLKLTCDNGRTVEWRALVLWLAASTFALSAGAADIEAPGVPNFHSVNEHVYRGGQPADAGWSSLAKLGVKTVIDLRPASEHSINKEERAVEAAGMRYVSEPLARLAAPTKEEIFKILTLLDSSAQWPVFIHCRRGADRTGTVIACYQIAHNQLANEEALREAMKYGMSRLELGMKHFIQNFHIDSPIGENGPEVFDSHR
jgi:tyrosine-protein phosphatase SIW14